MPRIFLRIDGGPWQLIAVGMSPSTLRLASVRVEPLAAGAPAPSDADGVLLQVDPQVGWAQWLPTGSPVRHNGTPTTATGLRMLEHRDALALADTVFFTTEDRPPVQNHAGAAVACPRCRKDAQPGDAVVCCPSYGVVHHENAALTCWSYGATCSCCKQPTALDAGLQWTPEAL